MCSSISRSAVSNISLTTTFVRVTAVNLLKTSKDRCATVLRSKFLSIYSVMTFSQRSCRRSINVGFCSKRRITLFPNVKSSVSRMARRKASTICLREDSATSYFSASTTLLFSSFNVKTTTSNFSILEDCAVLTSRTSRNALWKPPISSSTHVSFF